MQVKLCGKGKRALGAHNDTWAEAVRRAQAALADEALQRETAAYRRRIEGLMEGKKYAMPPCPKDPPACS